MSFLLSPFPCPSRKRLPEFLVEEQKELTLRNLTVGIIFQLNFELPHQMISRFLIKK